jgi:Uma2 family endonuclease
MTTLATRAAEGLDRRAFTVSDVERMIEAGVLDREEKFELIGGEIVPMPSQVLPHVIVKSRLARWLMQHAPDDLEVLIEPTVAVKERALFEPDIVICKPQPFVRGYLAIEDVRLAIAVADTSLARDLAKAHEYGRANLAELWILDLNGRQTLVFRTLNGTWTELSPVPFDQPLEALRLPGDALHIAPLTE